MGFFNEIIESFLKGVVGPVAGKMGRGWKTVTGIGLWLLVALARTLSEGHGFGQGTLDSIDSVLTYVQWAAVTLFGVGVVNKLENMDPPKQSPKSKK